MRAMIPAVALLTACGSGFRVDDSFSSSVDITLLGSAGEHRIASPYLLGSAFSLEFQGNPNRYADLELVSDDPSIFAIGPTVTDPDDDEIRYADVVAAAVGTTTVRAMDGDKERAAFEVRVGAPDQITVHPVALLVREDEGAVDVVRLVAGGAAEVELHPFDGSDLLTGSRYPGTSAPEALAVTNTDYRANDAHDVLLLEPSEAGTFTVQVPYGDTTLSFEAVATASVARLEVDCQDPASAVEGDYLYCQSQAFDADDDELFGVQPTWLVDDEALVGEGDLLAYELGGTDEHEAIATYGDRTASASFTGTAPEVQSTNDVVACSSLPASSLWLGLIPFGGLLLRRRR